jgi:CheY-like chemotaxis protein
MAGCPHVLIVDDDADLRSMLASVFENHGHPVTAVANGQLALDALGAAHGLIVLDLQMPVMYGRTFLAHKTRGVYAATPVIIFSSSPPDGLHRLRSVVAVVAKADGVEALLVAIPTGGRNAL